MGKVLPNGGMAIGADDKRGDDDSQKNCHWKCGSFVDDIGDHPGQRNKANNGNHYRNGSKWQPANCNQKTSQPGPYDH